MRTIAERKLEDSMGSFWRADVTGVRKSGDFVQKKLARFLLQAADAFLFDSMLLQS
jgi:hypothetical protein